MTAPELHPRQNPGSTPATGARTAHRGYAALLLASVGFALAAQHDTTGRAADRIVVKFVDDAQVRLRGAALVSLRGADMSSLEAVLTRFGRPLPARTLFRDEPAVDATRAAAESRSGRRLPDLNGYVEFAVDPDLRESLADALRGLALVETVYRPALLPPPPADIPPPTPDGEADLLYLDPAPTGIDAEYAWTRPGGGGLNVVVTDIEYSWRTAHEDLNSAVAAQRCGTPTALYIEHGTAVMGELFAGRNGYGTTGIAHQATPRFVTDLPSGGSYNVLAAISIATASGVVVVEPAGNGGEDLDHAVFGGKFNRSIRDSGAIVVGAGSTTYGPLPDRSRMDFSTYGSRVDIQGWGDDVGSTGYGDYFDGGGDPNQYYTSEFSGTSSASPMGAGAAAAIEGVQKSCGGAALAPRAVRDLLVQTGTAEVTGPNPGHIGPRPNLRAALARVDSDNDADSYAECEGDCDDARASIYPRAAETNDGLDNQCPGDPGYGVIDETSGDSGFHNRNDRTEYSWTAQSGATKYAVVRSDRATFPSSPTPCTKWETTALKILDSAKPPAAKVYYYLTRPILPRVGSWGQNSAGQERTGICP